MNSYKLVTEVSRIDCRLLDMDGDLKHYFTLDRMDKETVMIVGITFQMKRPLMTQIINCVRDRGFQFICFERPNRTVTYDIINNKFVKIEKD